jgi:hypothetical protein
MLNATPLAIYSECVRQMQTGACLTLQPASQPIAVAGVGLLSKDAWNTYVSLINPANLQDTAMCQRALAELQADPASDMSTVARVLWWTPDADQPAPASVAPVAVAAALAIACAALAIRHLITPNRA